MANDPPTNLRMGFGFPQARASGAPYVRPRSGHEMDWDIDNRYYEKKLNVLVKVDSSIGILAREKMKAMKSGKVWLRPDYCFEITRRWCGSATLLYYFVLYDRPELASKGYWDRVGEKYGWPVPPRSK